MTIRLYLQQNMFTPEQRDALFETIEAWNVAAHDAGTGVKIIPNPDWKALSITFKKTYCEKLS